MASTGPFLASIVVLVFLAILIEPHPVLDHQQLMNIGTVGSLVDAIDCGSTCGVRCSKSSRPNLCKRACGTCCTRCGCVPPGTYGNYGACPCYGALTTRGGRLKCP